jgi:hypothetical protein
MLDRVDRDAQSIRRRASPLLPVPAPLCGIVVERTELAFTLDAGRDFLNGNS